MELLKTNYTLIAAAFMTLLFLWWYIRYDLVLLGRIKKQLHELYVKFSGLSSEKDNMEKIDHIFSVIENEHLAGMWDAYSRKADKSDISDTFNVYDTILIPASRKRAEAIPPVLVTLGILAVFGGLLTGMSSMPGDVTPIELAPQLVKTASGALIAGMAGIALSIIFQLLDKRSYQAALTQLSKFCNIANTKLIYRDIKQEQKKNSIETLLTNIELEVRSSNSKIVQAVNALSIQMNSFMGDFGDKLLNTQNEGLRNMAESFIAQLGSTAGSYLKELEASYEKLSLAQKQSADYISTMLEAAGTSFEQQRTLNKASEEAVASILSCTEQISTNAQLTSEATEKTKDFALVLTDILRNAEQSEEEFTSKFSDIVTSMLQKLDTGLNSNIDRIGDASSRLLEELDNRVFSINVYTDVISKEIAGLSSNLNTSVETFGSQIDGCIKSTFTSFDSSIADICDRLGNTAEAIRDAVDELPKLLAVYLREEEKAKVNPDEK